MDAVRAGAGPLHRWLSLAHDIPRDEPSGLAARRLRTAEVADHDWADHRHHLNHSTLFGHRDHHVSHGGNVMPSKHRAAARKSGKRLTEGARKQRAFNLLRKKGPVIPTSVLK